MAHYVIYIPGLSDHKWGFQYSLIAAWKIYGIRTCVHRMEWRSSQPFAAKLQGLLQIVDRLHKEGHTVSLLGVSAGASMALHAFAARPQAVQVVVCLCGKIQNIQTVSAHTFRNNPAFKTSLTQLGDSLARLGPTERARILSVHPLRDGTVPIADTKLPGAQEKTIPTIGHALSIVYGLTLGSAAIVRFIRRSIKK